MGYQGGINLETFLSIVNEVKVWVKQNFEGRFEVDAIEINPVIFPIVQQTIKKEIFAKSPSVGELGMGIYSIEGIRIVKGKDPLSGIHIRLREIAESGRCPICGLPEDLCVCKEMAKEQLKP